MTRPAGRPPHVPTKASRLRVKQSAAGGMPHEWIAQAEGITAKTLRLRYREELTTGVRQELVKVRQALLRSAQKGNVSAAKFLAEHPPEDLTWPTRAPAPAPAAPLELRPVPPAAAEPLGKKATADLAAKTAAAGTDWAGLLDDSATTPIQ